MCHGLQQDLTGDDGLSMITRLKQIRVLGRSIPAIMVFIALCGEASAIGNSPFRIEVGYSHTLASAAGIVDLSRSLAVRLKLIEVTLAPSNSFAVGIPGSDGDIIFSPFRKKLPVEPYISGGLATSFLWIQDSSVAYRVVDLYPTLGLGAERLLFFLPKAPSVFLELGVIAGAHEVSYSSSNAWPPWILPQILVLPRVTVGLRL
jgi:hypothetical protein